MKKKLLVKIILGVLILVSIILPFIKPIKIKGNLIPYNYTVHGTYIEINQYTGGDYEVDIPAYLWFKPVQKIETGAFDKTYFLETVEIPNTVKEIGSAFDYCIKLENIKIGKRVKELVSGTFGACWNLKEIVIPENVEKVERYTFNSCESLESVIFYNPTVEIDENAFRYCNYDILTLKSTEGSTVEKYAKENGIKWEALETAEQ